MEYLKTSKLLFSITRIRKIVAFVQPRYCSNVARTTANSRETPAPAEKFKSRISSGPTFQDFIKGVSVNKTSVEKSEYHDQHTYFSEAMDMGNFRKVYFETYGCQMNVNDTEIAWSILQKKGYQRTLELSQADVVLLVTCSIREKAEQTIWNRLQQLTAMKKKRLKSQSPMKIGILGCMAERLKTEVLEREKLVDILAGPDAYRDLPRLLAVADGGQQASNVLLSLEETYADIMPVHHAPQGYSAYVSIMRGCDNMCTYCIVPFTRGRERSRPVGSVLEEVRMLSDQGVKEVTLLGQNVNSYRDTSQQQFCGTELTQLSRGFKTIYRTKLGGLRFSDLLDHVSRIDPDMRIRFTSPHPKDFPDEVLQLIAERKNICKQIHLPAQSGSSEILKAMRRGYTRETYLDLVKNIRTIIPEVSLSSDFISGFCGETEEDHQQTLSLIREVGYNVGFLFAYSMRKKTQAFHRLQDDVPAEVKQRRLEECISVFREEAARVNGALIGSTQLVLVEGQSKRSADELCGRTDGNTKVIFPKEGFNTAPINVGDYVLVKILSANSQSLRGRCVSHSSLRGAEEQDGSVPVLQLHQRVGSDTTATESRS
ncbi:mitochondrial tRNA methylthiotransferase CDK5RAP1 [Takifugu rubripes]|uniref:Mitochondrial tRNA methylthiotransferase CDK5RAP1 n=1 Tax=Takifugu rubripes TaxID=31033 RepID=A0A674P510_TAKRU|nr:CDK5 regulatory subunit-associated protein 1 [Takifugu rubripes]|eukprot:XP_003973777.1 PREDICTED: CDK5 regulatory subunit-associated protein 1 [Takifugu rubripes]